MFELTARQKERLLSIRAAWEEGEEEERLERLRQHEEDADHLKAFARLVVETDFATGRDLSYQDTLLLLKIVRSLAPNPNLDARLLRLPGEPAEFNRDLRDLLFGVAPLPVRLRRFQARRAVGDQTVTQFLCALNPAVWPLITLAGLRALELDPQQHRTAVHTARERFELPEDPDEMPATDPLVRLLGSVVVYTAVHDTLEAADYLEVHRLLTRGFVSATGPATRKKNTALYTLGSSSRGPIVREPAAFYTERPEPEGHDLPAPVPSSTEGLTERALLAYLEHFVAAQGFTYPPLTVRDYYISLQTKPFVILSGIAGSGKTRLTSLFAEALTDRPDIQYRLLPVRPDWADSTPLTGYVNLLAPTPEGNGKFVSTPFLDFLQRAAMPQNAYRAFFVCLDEINLARIEYYFAEVLSAMETAGRTLLLPGGRTVHLPSNFFLSGTLNADEATHTISRKVLDRANMISFHEVSLRDMPEPMGGETVFETMQPEQRQALFLQLRCTTVGAARAKLQSVGKEDADFSAFVISELSAANTILQPHGLHFAYRVRDEVLCYCANSFDRDGGALLKPEEPENTRENLRIALDLQLLQKVLPRLSGTREQVEDAVLSLLRWAEKSRYERTLQKLERVRARLQRDGFVSLEDV